jgi:sugar phosphate isomerase/epimerase
MKTLVQLFSARDFQPWDSVLDKVQHAGFDGVEGFSANYIDPAAFRALLDERGLIMPQGHFGLDLLESNFAEAVRTARTLGVDTVIAPYLQPADRPVDRDGWVALGRRLDLLDRKCRDEGFGFAWHNHDFELVLLETGDTPMDVLLDTAPTMNWEADLGWILRARANPNDWLSKRADRIVSVHLKDIQPNHETATEGGWADLGHGINRWEGIFKHLAGLPNLKAEVAEHDNPSDLTRFLGRWMSSFRRLSGH